MVEEAARFETPPVPQFREATAADLPRLLSLMRTYYLQHSYPFVEHVANAALFALLADDRLGRI